MLQVRRADFDEFDVKPYSYSGRFMYGKTCLAINVHSMGELIRFVQELTHDVELDPDHPLTEFAEIVNAVRSDQMGLGLVYYWPSVELVDDVPEEED